MKPNTNPNQTHALVIGGGIAGLMAARVLADYFERVTVIERDSYPDTPADRKGLPHARHTHFMLIRGWLALEHLLPGVAEDLVCHGAPVVELAADVRWAGRAGWYPRFPTGLVSVSCSRNMMEWGIRRHLARHEQINVLQETNVTGLLASADRSSIVGVQTVPYHPALHREGKATPIYADLIIDASGRTSQSPQWLADLGYASPDESVIRPLVGYASRFYRPPNGNGHGSPDWKTLLVQNNPTVNNRAASLLQVEHNRWSLTVSSVGGDYPPTDEAGFLAFTQHLASPAVYEFIKECEPSTPVYSYRIPRNRLRHYETMRRLPERYLVMGDAVCTLNPIYGQGMTVCAEAALTLAHALREQHERRPSGDLTGLSRRFQRQLARVIERPWLLSTGEDGRYPTTEGGQRDPLTNLMRWYTDGVIRYANESPRAYLTLLELLHLDRPWSTLLRPDLLVNALAVNLEQMAAR